LKVKVSETAKWTLIPVILFLAVLSTFTAVTRAVSGTNLPIAAVQTGSMEPNIPTGSLIFIQRVDGEDIVAGGPTVGDVVVYYFPDTQITDYFFVTIYDPTPWTHRVIAKTLIGGEYYLLTKGDANRSPDQNADNPYSWVPEERVIGKVVYHIPYLGYPFLWFKNTAVIAGVAIILLVMIIISMNEDRKRSTESAKPLEDEKSFIKVFK